MSVLHRKYKLSGEMDVAICFAAQNHELRSYTHGRTLNALRKRGLLDDANELTDLGWKCYIELTDAGQCPTHGLNGHRAKDPRALYELAKQKIEVKIAEQLRESSRSKPIQFWHVDAFANQPYTGNPAAVVMMDGLAKDTWMQSVASETNLSGTAFLLPTEHSDRFHLRSFTPTTEVDPCGHATLAAAHVLYECEHCRPDQPIRFHTSNEDIHCCQRGERIEMICPKYDLTRPVSDDESSCLQSAFACKPTFLARTKFDVLMVLADADSVRTARPNLDEISNVECRGVIITAANDDVNADFISRFFAPRCGINEDSVTGSSHCCLAPYWAQQLGKSQLTGYQASVRGGMVQCEVTSDRVKLFGNAVTILEGRLLGNAR